MAVDEVDVLGAEELMPAEEEPLAVALMDEPSPAYSGNGRVEELEAKVARLETELRDLHQSHREQLQAILKSIGDVTKGIRSRLDS